MLSPSPPSFEDLKEKLSSNLKPLNRSFQFWVRAADIYTSYKVCQLKVRFVKDEEKQEEMWEKQHEKAADKMYSLCYELGGLFLKVTKCRLVSWGDAKCYKLAPIDGHQSKLLRDCQSFLYSWRVINIPDTTQFVRFILDEVSYNAAQILGKPDLAPAAWVKRLVTLCDQAPATPFQVVRHTVEEELGKKFDDIFERFDVDPIGSASIAQVHRARLRSGKTDVAVKVQHPGVKHLMMVDIQNLQAFALFLQKTDIKFDLFSLTKEVETQIGYEFDFVREFEAMERIRKFFQANYKKAPVLVPRAMDGMATRKVLVMEFIDGIPIMNLGKEIARRGIDPGGKVAAMAKQKILKNLTLAYGQMILKDGFFHADPHPGNILICKDSEVALLDYGQVKHLPDNLRLGYANLVIGMADNDPARVYQSYRELGIDILSTCEDEERELLKLALKMFDTKLPPGLTILSPFADDSSLNQISVQRFPEELFSVMRTMQLLRGLSVGMTISHSCAEQWRPIAEETLYKAGRLKEEDLKARRPGFLKRIFGRKGL